LLVDDTHPIEAGCLPNADPDLYFHGFYCWNSEVGSKALSIASFYLRAICQNRNLWGVEGFEEISIGHSKFASQRFAHEAAPAPAQPHRAAGARRLAKTPACTKSRRAGALPRAQIAGQAEALGEDCPNPMGAARGWHRRGGFPGREHSARAVPPARPVPSFSALREKGQPEEEIAAAFFVSISVVRQRLRLASVSPRPLEVYAEDGLTLDQLIAFTVNGDRFRREQVFERLSSTKEPYIIRRMLTEDAIRATDKRAKFVGLPAYEEAGGIILHALFHAPEPEEHEGVKPIPDRLMTEIDGAPDAGASPSPQRASRFGLPGGATCALHQGILSLCP